MAEDLDIAFVRSLLPERPVGGHKGTFGHVVVVAGSRGFTGAVRLACEAAARSGAGLVTAAVPRPLGDAMASALLEPMSLMLPATDAESLAAAAIEPALDFIQAKQAAVIGPGLGLHPETRAFVLEFVARCPIPTVVDADGLNALSTKTAILRNAPSARILTPHPGEMARLTGRTVGEIQAHREQAAEDSAEEGRCIIVLKGYRTVVAGDGEVWINPTGNAGMATGGTGDVLSGLIGGLLAQGIGPLHAALIGTYVHGLAGDLAARTKTQRAMIARDVLEYIPQAWKAVEQADRL